MAGWTNKGKFRMLGRTYRGVAVPTNYYAALVTAAVAPVADTNTKSELTEVANGNGYVTGGIQLTPGATDFDVLTEDDTNDRAFIQLKDLVFTGAGGPIPASGDGPRYLILTDDNGTQGSREVYHLWDLGSAITVSDGQSLTVQDAEIRITE
jgi:hypothetical protein